MRPPGEPAPGELIPAAITERDENPGETRLALNLGAANLSVASVQLETAEPLFMRQVSVAVPQDFGGLHSRTNHRARRGLSRRRRRPATLPKIFPCRWKIWCASRELIFFIKNGDSPPLPDFCRARGAAAGLSRFPRAAAGHISFAHRQRSLRRAALRSGRAGHESERRASFTD